MRASRSWPTRTGCARTRGAHARHVRFRADRFSQRLDGEPDGSTEERSLDYQRLRRELLGAERDAVVELRRARVISDDVMNRVLRDIALEDVRLDFER